MKSLMMLILVMSLGAMGPQDKVYQQGKDALKQQDWSAAVSAFDNVIERGVEQTDAALYWRAFALVKMAQPGQALTALNTLTSQYPQSAWLDDAAALKVELDMASGRTTAPDRGADDGLKMAALMGMMRADPDKALEYVNKILDGNDSDELKKKALFVLAQSGSLEAGDRLAKVATTHPNEDLRKQAILFLGLYNDDHGQLMGIYKESENSAIRSAVLQGFMAAGATEPLAQLLRSETDEDMIPHIIRNLGLSGGTEALADYYKTASKQNRLVVLQTMYAAEHNEFLVNVAKSDPDHEMRAAAVHSLGISGDCETLTQIYATETHVEVKEKIIQGMFLGQTCDDLIRIARQEENEDLRHKAIHAMGIGGDRYTKPLQELYAGSDSDMGTKKAVIQALFIQGADKIMVDMARQETDSELKRDLIQKLSLRGSKEAIGLMQELLDQ